VSGVPLICFSVAQDEYERLAAGGPRRDIPQLAHQVGGELLFRTGRGNRRGLRGKLFGPQIRHAWEASGRASRDGVVFADGEHVGFPLAAFLGLRRRRGVRLVVLGHFVDKRWKRFLLRAATLFVPRGTLVLHSVTQAERLADILPQRWNVSVLPYQVDSEYWQPQAPVVGGERPLIVSAGSENRDYATLIESVRGLEVDVCIASGSHWAREEASARFLPANVTLLTGTLAFERLRDLYARASLVVVPLHPVANQSGITTILEAMSMAKPVIVTATPGQREAIAGPLVLANGSLQAEDRGPHLLGLPRRADPSGVYVPPADSAALREAIRLILGDAEFAGRLGNAARRWAATEFSVELFAERFGRVIAGDERAARAAEQAVAVS
jgi:glycosyltransferase involved in cell wall biosynthesis